MNKTPSPTHATHKTPPAPPEAAAKPEAKAPAPGNPDDGKHGQQLLARVQERRQQLIATLAQVKGMTTKGEPESIRAAEIEKALAAVETMLTGDLNQISHTNGDDMARWLQSSEILPTGKAGKPVPTHKDAPTKH